MPQRDLLLTILGYGCMLAGMVVVLMVAWSMAGASAHKSVAPDPPAAMHSLE
jgi:methionine-rich copper-binding protein CopC